MVLARALENTGIAQDISLNGASPASPLLERGMELLALHNQNRISTSNSNFDKLLLDQAKEGNSAFTRTVAKNGNEIVVFTDKDGHESAFFRAGPNDKFQKISDFKFDYGTTNGAAYYSGRLPDGSPVQLHFGDPYANMHFRLDGDKIRQDPNGAHDPRGDDTIKVGTGEPSVSQTTNQRPELKFNSQNTEEAFKSGLKLAQSYLEELGLKGYTLSYEGSGNRVRSFNSGSAFSPIEVQNIFITGPDGKKVKLTSVLPEKDHLQTLKSPVEVFQLIKQAIDNMPK